MNKYLLLNWHRIVIQIVAVVALYFHAGLYGVFLAVTILFVEMKEIFWGDRINPYVNSHWKEIQQYIADDDFYEHDYNYDK